MMSYFNIRIGLSGEWNQAQLMNEFKTRGDDVIQTSNGLCVRTNNTPEAISLFLKEKGISTKALSKIDADSENLTADELAFLGLR